MLPEIEQGGAGAGIQSIRIVADVINDCNLRCSYCHPNFGWTKDTLSLDLIKTIFYASEKKGILEITLTGGEITIHPEFTEIMEATHILQRTSSTFITNAINITPDLAKVIEKSNITRICVSLDGADEETHNSRRGNNYKKVMRGLITLRDIAISKQITVISVAHSYNYNHLLILSHKLADEGLADQHHINAPCYSGSAKNNFDEICLKENQFYELQSLVDFNYSLLTRKGVLTTFNSFWPALGERGKSQLPRTMTLVQFTEQVKDIYSIIRPNGDLRLTCAAWGRETVGNAVVGNLKNGGVDKLFEKVDGIYRSGKIKQLPREVEAGHKFYIGPFSPNSDGTNNIVNSDQTENQNSINWIPITKLSQIDLLNSRVSKEELETISRGILQKPDGWRILHHSSGVDVVFDCKRALITLLKPEELSMVSSYYQKTASLFESKS